MNAKSDAETNMEVEGWATIMRAFTTNTSSGQWDDEPCPFPNVPECEHRHRMLNGGDQHRFGFRNGHGASVVKHGFSYGSMSGLWELAVTDHEGHLKYDTPITDDVIGRLSDSEVSALLAAIAALP